MSEIQLNEDKLDEVDLETEDVTKENEDSNSSIGNFSSAHLPSASKEVSPEKEELLDPSANHRQSPFIPISHYSPSASPLSEISSVNPGIQTPSYTPQISHHYPTYSSFSTQTHVNQPLNNYYGQRTELRSSQHYYQSYPNQAPYYYQPQPMPYQGYNAYSGYTPASPAPLTNQYPYIYNQNYESYLNYPNSFLNQSANVSGFNTTYDRNYNYSGNFDHSRPSLNQTSSAPNPLPLPPLSANMPPNYLEWFEAYSRWYNKMYKKNEQGQVQRQRLTPLLYPTRHSRINFGPLNQLVVSSGQNLILYHLDPHLIDNEGQLMITTWPGPLNKTETNRAELLEFIKSQEGCHQILGEPLEVLYHNKEKKQIWRILLMLVRQNGHVSGSDLTELLLHFNEQEFQSDSEESSELSKFRKFLILGQRKTGLEYAAKNGLWGHALALTFLTMPQEMMPSSPPESMLNIVSKFFNGSLDRDDPLFVLYQCLYQNQKHFYFKNKAKLLPTSNLQQFAILLANDCEVSTVITGSNYCSELLKFVIAIRNHHQQHLINVSPLAFSEYESKKENKLSYSEELLFINEIFEYGKVSDEIIYDLIPFKLIFVTKLFDFGLINQAKKYCQALRNVIECVNHEKSLKEANVNCQLVLRIINEIENRLQGTLIYNNSEDFFLSFKTDSEKIREEKLSCTPADISEQIQALSITSTKEPASGDTKSVFELTSNAESENLNVINQAQNKDLKDDFSEITKEEVEENYLPQTSIQSNYHVSQPPLLTQTSIHQTTVDNSKISKWKPRQPPTLTINQQPNLEDNNNAETLQQASKFQTAVNPFPSTTFPFNYFGTEDDKASLSSFSVVNPKISKQKLEEVEKTESNTYTSSQDVLKLNSTSNNLPTPQFFSPIISPIASPSSEQNQISPNLKKIKPTSMGQESNLEKDNWTKFESDNQTKDDKEKVGTTGNAGVKSKGVLDYIFSKVSSRGPKRAILPDDREPSIVWDKTLNRWVDKTLGKEHTSDLTMNGPPKIPLVHQPSESNDLTAPKSVPLDSKPSFQPLNPDQLCFTKTKKKRYVDILQQQR